eukprot:72443_1
MSGLDLDPIWIYLASIIGICGAIIIACIGAHTIYHEQRSKIGLKLSRVLSVLFFTSCWITCIAFAFFRSNLILPMGTSIDCHFGFLLSINGVFVSKVLLFIIFLYRIHFAFSRSALRYSVPFLITVSATYMIIISVLNGLFIAASTSVIRFRTLLNDSTLGICTTEGTGTDEQENRIITVLACIALGDLIYSIFICGLFVHKLRSAIKMTKAESESHGQRKMKLILLARKQTTLVIVACVTSILTIGMSAVTAGPGYCVSLDVATNAVCVWLMYSFNKKIWKGCIKYVCCCCYCCVNKETFAKMIRAISMSSARSKPAESRDQIQSATAEHTETVSTMKV